ncbi:MAG: TolC family protein [Nitrospinales bacterium]
MCLLASILWSLSGVFPLALAAGKKEVKPIPPLADTLQIVFKNLESVSENPGRNNLPSRVEIENQVKQFYYQILFKREQLKIAEEVKGHFEKALTKAEEKYEAGDDDVSQSSITKLKLGLAGTENDIAGLKADMELARLSLGRLMGWEITSETPMAEKKIRPVDFPFVLFKEYLEGRNPGGDPQTVSGEKEFDLRKALIHVNEAREKMNLAGKIKKITRALLVTEVANYDFGIGDSKDLFEALIIYTRVLKGFYETIYNFNMAVADMHKIEQLPSAR